MIPQKTIEELQDESKRILEKYPDKIPIIISTKDDNITVDKNKYIVPRNITMGQFIYIVRKKISLGPGQALFFFCDKKLPITALYCPDVFNLGPYTLKNLKDIFGILNNDA